MSQQECVSESQQPSPQLTDLRAVQDTAERINDDIQKRRTEIHRLGQFDTAICTGFNRPAEGVVEFQYELPDGAVATQKHNMNGEMEALRQLLVAQDADDVEQMVGTEHACIHASGGWNLWKSPSVRDHHVVQFRTDEDSVFTVSMWSLLASIVILAWPLVLLPAEPASMLYFCGWLLAAFLPVSLGLRALGDSW